MAELGLTYEDYGEAAGRLGLGFAFGSLVFGVLADSARVARLFPLVVLVWSLAAITTGRAQGFVGLWVSRAALGFFEAGHWPCALRTTQRVFAPGRRPWANSVLQAGAPLGAILASLVALAFFDAEEVGSWRALFFYLGILGVPWAVLWLVLVRPRDLERPVLQTGARREGEAAPLEEVPMEEVPLWAHFLSRRYWLLILHVVCINTCWHYIRVWLPPALEKDLEYTSREVQLFFVVYWLSTFAGSMACGWLTESLKTRGWGVHRARMAAFFLFSVLTALMVPAAFLEPGWLFLALLLLVGFGSLGLFPIYYSLTQELTARHQGKISGALAFTTWAILYFVHPAIGRLMDDRPETRPYIFAGIGLLPLVGWALVSLGWGERPKRLGSHLEDLGRR